MSHPEVLIEASGTIQEVLTVMAGQIRYVKLVLQVSDAEMIVSVKYDERCGMWFGTIHRWVSENNPYLS